MSPTDVCVSTVLHRLGTWPPAHALISVVSRPVCGQCELQSIDSCLRQDLHTIDAATSSGGDAYPASGPIRTTLHQHHMRVGTVAMNIVVQP